MRRVHVLGVSVTAFSPAGPPSCDLVLEAAAGALADADLAWTDLGALALCADGADGKRIAAAVRQRLRADAIRLRRADSGAAALHAGFIAVASGAHDVVLCLGRSAGGDGDEPPLARLAADARRYMNASGATEQHLARVTAKNLAHGARNPRALVAAVDADHVLAGDVLDWPLRRLMVARPSAGVAAVVLGCSDAGPRHGPRAIPVRACVVRRGEALEGPAGTRVAGLAYEAADLGPEDVDCAEIDAPTAAGELAAYETLQFAPEGAGPELVDSGFTALGGVLPVNTSGGPLAQGCAIGASGLAQVCELAWQLRGRADRRQVPGARAGLALAVADGDRSLVAVTVLGAR